MKPREIRVTGHYGTAVAAEPCAVCGGSTATGTAQRLMRMVSGVEADGVYRMRVGHVLVCSDVCERKATE
jgi:hypothetical protein